MFINYKKFLVLVKSQTELMLMWYTTLTADCEKDNVSSSMTLKCELNI